MSKGRKDGVDWKNGAQALLRAARADHEATTDDYARVKAELARRLAAGALPKRPIDGELATSAKLTGASTGSSFTKQGIALLLMAAGSFGAVQILEHGGEHDSLAGSRAEDSRSALATPAVERTQPLDSAPAATATERRSTPRPQARHDSFARGAPSRDALRSLAPSRLNARHNAKASAESKPANETGMQAPRSVAKAASTDSTATTSTPASGRASAESKAKEPSAYSLTSRGTSRDQPKPAPMTQAAQPRAEASKPQTRPAPKSVDERAELALLERMQAAMRAAKPTQALELCAEHKKSWPRGVFVEEREAVTAIASCALRSDDAAARAQLFLIQHPRAPTALRVAAACAPLSAATKSAATH